MNKTNPFQYKKVAKLQGFYNRTSELQNLLSMAESSFAVLLIAPRRFGKSSLLERLRYEFKARDPKNLAAHIDLFRANDLSEMVRLICKSLLKELRTPWDKIRGLIKNGVPKLAPLITVSAEGEPELSLKMDNVPHTLDTLEEFLIWFDSYSHSSKKLVILDEFQQIYEFPEAVAIEKRLRAIAQHFQNTAIFYSGSSPSLLKEAFSNRKRPFYQSAKMIELGFTSRDDAQAFLVQMLNPLQLSNLNEVSGRVAEITEGHPYYVQLFGAIIWSFVQGGELKGPSDVDRLLLPLVFQEERVTFEAMMNSLTGKQRKLFRAICLQPEKPITSSSFLNAHHLGAASSVSKSCKKLEQLGFILLGKNGYRASDPLLSKWWAQGF